MRRNNRRLGIGMTVLTVGLMASAASSDQARSGQFFAACAAADPVDKAMAATICAEFLAVLQDQPGLSVQPEQPVPLSMGPGLEIVVERATEVGLEVTPTWVDAQGNRATQPSVGVRISDARMSEPMRRDFFARLIANFPK